MSTIIIVLFVLVCLVIYLVQKKEKKQKNSLFGSTFDFSKIPNKAFTKKNKVIPPPKK